MAYQSEIEKLTARWKENPDQYFAPLADACRKSGDIDYALEVVRAGLERRPTYLSAHIVLGRCLLDQKNDAEAGKVFEHVLELDAENTTGKVQRLPVREDIKLPIQEQLIVELYSR